MLEVENIETYGWEAAIRGMRNPMNSWDKSDSDFSAYPPRIGENDMRLMCQLIKAGSDHAKYLRMIGISMDIIAPRYWWPEWDSYKVGIVRDSCSTMHKIHSKQFTLDDFSHEHLDIGSISVLKTTIKTLNHFRALYNTTHDKANWWQLIQLLPQSYNQRATVTLNYEVARRMYAARKAHRLDEWHTLCEVFEGLPNAKDLIVCE